MRPEAQVKMRMNAMLAGCLMGDIRSLNVQVVHAVFLQRRCQATSQKFRTSIGVVNAEGAGEASSTKEGSDGVELSPTKAFHAGCASVR